MKALLILTLVSGLSAEPPVYPSLDTCMEAKDKISTQEGIKNAVCVPHSPIDTTERDVDKFRNMISVFMELIEMIEIHEAQIKEDNERDFDNERPWYEYGDNKKCGSGGAAKNGLFKPIPRCGARCGSLCPDELPSDAPTS